VVAGSRLAVSAVRAQRQTGAAPPANGRMQAGSTLILHGTRSCSTAGQAFEKQGWRNRQRAAPPGRSADPAAAPAPESSVRTAWDLVTSVTATGARSRPCSATGRPAAGNGQVQPGAGPQAHQSVEVGAGADAAHALSGGGGCTDHPESAAPRGAAASWHARDSLFWRLGRDRRWQRRWQDEPHTAHHLELGFSLRCTQIGRPEALRSPPDPPPPRCTAPAGVGNT
jgi:hypothetical protein